ncbi:MAG TPA: hypothetical protein VJT49_02195 [Amycolatopsis sp.]|uniref:hypothetical protein n=1 Tax=Amycolatopsis sp. TaxID=37632 RepID=UPI002B46F163|nr:hypothetical protein [Amycolatopsis sp.]HKS43922.1 hypothetical protein [Amycolatopsis sp.]
MSAVFVDSGLTGEYLLDTWPDMKVPEGWRPELTVEKTPPSGGNAQPDRRTDASRTIAGCS